MRSPQLFQHDSRVYSSWVNGNKNVYFHCDAKGLAELLQLYCGVRLRDYAVTFRKGSPDVATFGGRKIAYNVHLHVLGGILLGSRRRGDQAETFEPTLTVHLDEATYAEQFPEITVPEKAFVTSQIPGWPAKNRRARPERHLWYAKVHFGDGNRAVDFERLLFADGTPADSGITLSFPFNGVTRLDAEGFLKVHPRAVRDGHS